MVGVLCNVRSLSDIQWVIEAPLVILISSPFLSLSGIFCFDIEGKNLIIALVSEIGMQHRSFRKWKVLITGA